MKILTAISFAFRIRFRWQNYISSQSFPGNTSREFIIISYYIFFSRLYGRAHPFRRSTAKFVALGRRRAVASNLNRRDASAARPVHDNNIIYYSKSETDFAGGQISSDIVQHKQKI